MKKVCLNGGCKLGLLDDQFYPEGADFRKISDILVLEKMTVIDAQIPSNFEIDMQRAKLLPDIFVGENPLLSQKLEMEHLFYSKTFDIKDAEDYQNPYFVFNGIDTFSDIYLNGVPIGNTDNMQMAYEFAAKGLRTGRNELFVHITPVAIKAREYDYAMGNYTLKYNGDNMQVRKANYMAGWDIFLRNMSGGIWRDVALIEKPKICFRQNYLFTNSLAPDFSQAELCLYYELDLERERYSDYRISVEGICGESVFSAEDRIWSKAGRLRCIVQNPKLWWPRGSGEQNLYHVTVGLFKQNILVDEKIFRAGIRTVELDRTSVTDDEGCGEFCFKINYRKIFVLGTNWVPLDSFPSQGKKKIEKALALVEDIGCNMIRCWGGGYYEDELFYDICDEKGFLVWQDFMMACGIYPQDLKFLFRLETELIQVVQRLRQHPCLAIWAGDNECDAACGWSGNYADPNGNAITRQLIPKILRSHDYVRPYLPSSPYLDEEGVKLGEAYLTEAHLWGTRDYFKNSFYRNARAHFASEIGYHGCPSAVSVRKFITEDALWPYENNPQWFLHASSNTTSASEPHAFRIMLMAKQIKVLFGEIPDNLDEFSLLSQISQAEALKFFIERFRIGKWRRTGLIWWNILDGCPQFSDAVVDYYFDKKLAYYYIKQSQQPVCLMFDEPKEGRIELIGVNDTMDNRQISYTITDLQDSRVIGKGTALLLADSSQTIANFPEQKENTIWHIEWNMNGEVLHNHYACGSIPFSKEKYVGFFENLKYKTI